MNILARFDPFLKGHASPGRKFDGSPSDRRTYGIGAKILTVFCSTAVVLATLEIAVRIIEPVGWERPPVFLADEQTGWRLAPNQDGYRRNYSVPDLFCSRFRTNSLGMRDREYTLENGQNLRVLVVGDSMTEGWGVEGEEAYPKVLENRFLRDIEVWNLGVVSYGTDQELQQLRRFIGQSRPHLVLLGFYENDVADNTRDEAPWYPRLAKPLFAIQGSELVVVDSDKLRGQWESMERQSHSWAGELKAFLKHSALARLASFAIRKTRYSRTEGKQANRKFLDTWVRHNPYRVEPTEETVHGWQITERLLVEMRRLTASQNARFVILYIPSAEEILPSEIERRRDILGKTDVRLPENRLREIAERNGIEFIATHSIFASNPQPQQLYLPHPEKDGHLSVRGQLLLAQAVAEYLHSKGWLPESAFQMQNLKSLVDNPSAIARDAR